MNTSITAQGTFLQVKIPSEMRSNGGGGKRKKIRTFSNQARKAMFTLFHKLKVKHFIFITLTYGQNYPDSELAKHHLKLFIMRLKYRYPQLAGVWRIELQERGAPHFHLLLTYLPFVPKEEICRLWERVIGKKYRNNSKPFGGSRKKTFTRIEFCKNKKKVFGYLSKYVAKKSEPQSGDSGFNSVAKRQIYAEHCEAPPILPSISGKHWGIIGTEFLPYAKLRVVEFVGNPKVFYQFRRSCKNYYAGLKVFRADAGLTLFCGDAYQWLRYWHRLSMQQFEPMKTNCFGVID